MKRFMSIFLTVCMVVALMPGQTTAYWCNHDYKLEVHPPVCDRMGYTIYTCQLCGYTFWDDYVDAPGHPELVDGFCTQCNGYEAAVLNEGVYEIYNPSQRLLKHVNKTNPLFE